MENNEVKLIVCEDGSHTLYVPKYDEHYHSIHGAIQESLHVFIEMGFDQIKRSSIDILEIGFGTGLNAFLTYYRGSESNSRVYYTAIEPFLLKEIYWRKLNYPEMLSFANGNRIFENIHNADWNKDYRVDDKFYLHKIDKKLEQLVFNSNSFDLVYFDAFSPNVQPELWTVDVFKKMFDAMRNDGVLVTYSSKGIVKNALRDSGFIVERIKGAGGKRHMVRAKKNVFLKH